MFRMNVLRVRVRLSHWFRFLRLLHAAAEVTNIRLSVMCYVQAFESCCRVPNPRNDYVIVIVLYHCHQEWSRFSILIVYLPLFQPKIPGPRNCTRITILYPPSQECEHVFYAYHVSAVVPVQDPRPQELYGNYLTISTASRIKARFQALSPVCHSFSAW